MSDLDPIEPWPPIRPPAEEMLWMADAFAKAAEVLCIALAEDDFEREYSSTQVVLHLCRHATELFLKGAISAKTNQPPRKTHRLERLYAEYRLFFPRDKHQVHFPFPEQVFDYEGGLFPGSLEDYQRAHDQRFRYPTDAAGRRFENLEPFDVEAYRGAIERFRSELNHMVARITWNFDF